MLAAPAARACRSSPNEAQRRVDITVDGQPFTSYIWPTTLKKPVLYPLIDADGITLTRGYPLDPRPASAPTIRTTPACGSTTPTSTASTSGTTPMPSSLKLAPRWARFVQTKIVSTKSGADRGELVVESVWIDGQKASRSSTRPRATSSRTPRARARHRQIVTLKALDPVVFNDDKDGMLGMRVARWLESPEEKGGVFLDANGRPTTVAAADTSGATGVYLTSEGMKGEAAWGTRGRWCALTGHTGDHTVTIAILDHPENPGYPTYWHARGYGLFAANPLGAHLRSQAAAVQLHPREGQTATFRYRVLLISHEASRRIPESRRRSNSPAKERSVDLFIGPNPTTRR